MFIFLITINSLFFNDERVFLYPYGTSFPYGPLPEPDYARAFDYDDVVGMRHLANESKNISSFPLIESDIYD
jgi:hypothetical protein